MHIVVVIAVDLYVFVSNYIVGVLLEAHIINHQI